MFNRDPKTQPDQCRCFYPGNNPLPVLPIPFSSKIDPIGIGIKCLTLLCICEAIIGNLAISVVKIAPQ